MGTYISLRDKLSDQDADAGVEASSGGTTGYVSLRDKFVAEDAAKDQAIKDVAEISILPPPEMNEDESNRLVKKMDVSSFQKYGAQRAKEYKKEAVDDAEALSRIAGEIGAFKEAYIQADLNIDKGRLGYLASEGLASGDDMTELKELSQKLAASAQRTKDDPYIGKAVGNLAPFLVESAEKGGKGALIGATIFGAGTALASALTPVPLDDALMPITVPAAAMAGAKVGSMFMSVDNMREIEQGHAFLEMIDSGVDPAISKWMARSYGVASSGLEMVGFKLLRKLLPGGDQIARNAMGKAVKSVLKNRAVAAGANVGSVSLGEASVEGSQELVGNVMEEFAKYINDALKGTDLGAVDALDFTQKALANVPAVFGQTLIGMGVTAIPGTTVNFVIDATGKIQAEQAVQVDPIEEVVEEVLPEPTPKEKLDAAIKKGKEKAKKTIKKKEPKKVTPVEKITPIEEEIKPKTEKKPDKPIEKLPKKLKKEPSLDDLKGEDKAVTEAEAIAEEKAIAELGVEGITKEDLKIIEVKEEPVTGKVDAPKKKKTPAITSLKEPQVMLPGGEIIKLETHDSPGRKDQASKAVLDDMTRIIAEAKKKYPEGSVGYPGTEGHVPVEQIALDKIGTEEALAEPEGAGGRFRGAKGAKEVARVKRQEAKQNQQAISDAKAAGKLRKGSKKRKYFDKLMTKVRGAANNMSKNNPSDYDDLVSMATIDMLKEAQKDTPTKKFSVGFFVKNALKEIRRKGFGGSRRQVEEGKIPSLEQLSEDKVAGSTEDAAIEEGTVRSTEAVSLAKDREIITETDIIEAEGKRLGVKVDVYDGKDTIRRITEKMDEVESGPKLTALLKLRLQVKGTILPGKEFDTSKVPADQHKAVLEAAKAKRAADEAVTAAAKAAEVAGELAFQKSKPVGFTGKSVILGGGIEAIQGGKRAKAAPRGQAGEFDATKASKARSSIRKIGPEPAPKAAPKEPTAKIRRTVTEAIEAIDKSRRDLDRAEKDVLEATEGTPERAEKLRKMRARVAKQDATKKEKKRKRATQKRQDAKKDLPSKLTDETDLFEGAVADVSEQAAPEKKGKKPLTQADKDAVAAVKAAREAKKLAKGDPEAIALKAFAMLKKDVSRVLPGALDKDVELDLADILEGERPDYVSKETYDAIRKSYVKQVQQRVSPQKAKGKGTLMTKAEAEKSFGADVKETVLSTTETLDDDKKFRDGITPKELAAFKEDVKKESTKQDKSTRKGVAKILGNNKGETMILPDIVNQTAKVVTKAGQIAKAGKRMVDKSYDLLDVEARWKRMKADSTGLAVKTFHSVKALHEDIAANVARNLVKSVRSKVKTKGDAFKEDLADVVFAAEDPDVFKSFSEEKQAQLGEAVNMLRTYFDNALLKYNEVGIDGINYYENKIAALRKEMGKMKDINKMTEMNKTLAKLERLKFVHLPKSLWFNTGKGADTRTRRQREAAKRKRGYDILVAKRKRHAVTLKDLVDNESIAMEKKDIDPVGLLLNYGHMVGTDMAMVNLREAGLADGFISKAKSKPQSLRALSNQLIKLHEKLVNIKDAKKRKRVLKAIDAKDKQISTLEKLYDTDDVRTWDRLSSQEFGAFKGMWLDTRLIDALHTTQAVDDRQGWYEKQVAVVKMAQFYNPIFMPAYDIWQAGAMGGLVRHPVQWMRAIGQAAKDVNTMSERHQRAAQWGTFSKPFSNPMGNIADQARAIQKVSKYDGVLGSMLDATTHMLEAQLTPEGIKQQYADKKTILKIPVGGFYNAAWNAAWTMDAIIRQGTFNYLTERGMSDKEAAQGAAKIHADYAGVPATTRKVLNKVIFTPTFAISMVKVQTSMINEAIRFAARRDQTKGQKQLALGALTTAATIFGMHLGMLAMGYEPEKWGRSYVKTYDTPSGPRQVKINLTTPLTKGMKYFNWLVDYGIKPIAGGAPARTAIVSDFMHTLSFEGTPLLRTVAGVAANKKPNGDKIHLSMDDGPIKALKIAKYIMTDTLAFLDQGQQAFPRVSKEDNDEMLEQLHVLFRITRRLQFTFISSRLDKDRRFAAQLNKLEMDFEQDIAQLIKRDKEHLIDKIADNYEKRIIQLEENFNNE